MRVYGFGIIGCGMISDYTAQAIAELPNARLVAVSSRTESKRRRLMERYGCEGTADYRELAARGDVDVVCICTPSGAHLEPAIAASEAGKHLTVEKPIEVDLPRTDAVIAACERNKVQLCAIYPYRFTPAALALRDAIERGRFGRITVGDCYNKWWRPQSYYDGDSWRGTWELDGGGACMNQGSHAIDLIQWYMGPVESLCGYAGCLAHQKIEVEDTAVAAVRYKSGALGVIECATSTWPGLFRKIEIHGERGTVIMENELFAKWEFAEELPEDKDIRERMGAATGMKSAGAADPRAITHDNHREQIRDFLRAIETGGRPLVDGPEGRKAVEIIVALYRSAKTGAPVRLPI
jgi:UDP-N-acetyl-2-amino-2-deoxyglucuronate dehydrogenase